jgi:uncharacterized protein (DUF2267 family)
MTTTSTLITLDELVSALNEGGIVEHASRLATSTLAVLGERLTRDESLALSRRLAPPLDRILRESTYDGDLSEEELYERVRRRSALDAGAAREGAQVALTTLRAGLPDDDRARLERALPSSLARRIAPREVGEPAEHPDASRERLFHPASNPHGDRKLSSGHPAGGTPLSEGFRRS